MAKLEKWEGTARNVVFRWLLENANMTIGDFYKIRGITDDNIAYLDKHSTCFVPDFDDILLAAAAGHHILMFKEVEQAKPYYEAYEMDKLFKAEEITATRLYESTPRQQDAISILANQVIQNEHPDWFERLQEWRRTNNSLDCSEL